MPAMHSRSCTGCESNSQPVLYKTSACALVWNPSADSRTWYLTWNARGAWFRITYLKQVGQFRQHQGVGEFVQLPAGQTFFGTKTDVNRSPRRWDLKYVDRQIGQFSCPVLWVTGTPVYFLKKLFEFCGTPVKTSVKVTATPMKTCWNFDSSNHSDSNLLRLWCTHTIMYIS